MKKINKEKLANGIMNAFGAVGIVSAIILVGVFIVIKLSPDIIWHID